MPKRKSQSGSSSETIRPSTDLVFKAIMGHPDHPEILLEFLNAVMAPRSIVDVEVLNPAPVLQTLSQKQVILDVHAKDRSGVLFQIEMQSNNHAGLEQRMIYGLCRLYSSRIGSGSAYRDLRPVVGVWILDQALWPQTSAWHHAIGLHDPVGRTDLSEHLRLHVLELPKHQEVGRAMTGLDPWMAFFRRAGDWSAVPAAYKTRGTEAAMAILQDIRDSAYANDLARRRQDELRVQRDIAQYQEEIEAALVRSQVALEAEREEKEAERAEKEAEKQRADAEKQRADAEKQRADAERAEKEGEKQRADAERAEKEAEKQRADRLEAELAALRAGRDASGSS